MSISIHLHLQKTLEYLQGPTAQWNMGIKGPSQINEDDDTSSPHTSLVGIPSKDILIQSNNDDDNAPSEAPTFMDSFEVKYQNL
jgi:hypothetical protein